MHSSQSDRPRAIKLFALPGDKTEFESVDYHTGFGILDQWLCVMKLAATRMDKTSGCGYDGTSAVSARV